MTNFIRPLSPLYSPEDPQYRFSEFYRRLKEQGFVIYPCKVSQSDCFRIGNIGEVYAADITALLTAIRTPCTGRNKEP